MKIPAVMVVSVAIVGIATPAFAQLPVPTVQAPVPVPTVQAPVPVPTVRVPVPVPTVQVPVPVPTVQVPKVPDVPVPVPTSAPPSGGGSGGGGSPGAGATAPSTGSSGSGSSSSGGGSGSGSSSSGGGSGSGSSSSGGGSGSSSSSGGGSSPSSSGGGPATSSSPGSSSNAPSARSTAGRTASASRAAAAAPHTRTPAQRCSGRAKGALRRDCELRETVADTSRCLGDLSTGQRRVLTLRAGVGAGPPRSRGGVAKRLRISERRVARLERTGLRRLRTLGKAGACAPPAAATQTVAAGDVALGTSTALSVANPAGRSGESTPGTKTGAKPRDGASDGPAAKVPPIGGIAGESATNPGGGSFDLTLPLILLVLAALAVALARQFRRQMTPAAAGEIAADEDRHTIPAWIPWHRSTMKGPGWNDPRPPTDHPGEWSDKQRRTQAPKPEEHHEEWTPPTHRSPTHRR